MKAEALPQPGPDRPGSDLKKLAASALRWAIFARIGVQILRWAATIIVIRLLAPGDYGMMAMAMAIVSLATLFNELGVRMVIIRNADLTTSQIGSLQVFVAGINVVLFLIVVATAPLVSWLYGSDITDVLRVCAVTFLTYAVGSVQEALLIRAMNFKKRAYAETTAQLTGTLLSLALAFFGFGVWALVFGFVAVRIISAWSFYAFVPERYPWRFHYADIRPYIGYAGGVSLQRVISWVPTNLIPMTLGILSTQQMLGYYVVGQNLAFLPLRKFGAAFQQVGTATYAKSRTETKHVVSVLRKSLCYLTSIFFPYALFVVVVAPLTIDVVLGPTWSRLAPFVQIMVLALPFRACTMQIIVATNVIGDVKTGLSIGTIQAVLIFGMVVTGSFFGLAGAALGWAISVPITHAMAIALTRHCLPMNLAGLMVVYLRSIGVGIGVAALLLGVQPFLIALQPLLQLAILCALGAAGFIVLSLAINRAQIKEIFHFIRS